MREILDEAESIFERSNESFLDFGSVSVHVLIQFGVVSVFSRPGAGFVHLGALDDANI